MKKYLITRLAAALGLLLLLAALLPGLRGKNAAEPDANSGVYRKITAEEAKKLIDGGDVTVVDVRTPEEYAAAHLPDAINVPNEDIGEAQPQDLPDLEAALVVYCRTGVRSKQASDKLAALGYRNIYDMGGIVDWPYDTQSGT